MEVVGSLAEEVGNHGEVGGNHGVVVGLVGSHGVVVGSAGWVVGSLEVVGDDSPVAFGVEGDTGSLKQQKICMKIQCSKFMLISAFCTIIILANWNYIFSIR